MTRRPVLGALAVATRGDRVLLVQRGQEPDKGLWGYPGGKVEWGETIPQAALRELFEETGITATAGPQIGFTDVIQRQGDRVLYHYFLVAVHCREPKGQAVAGDDAADARWVPFDDVLQGRLPMSADVDTVLERLLEGAP